LSFREKASRSLIPDSKEMNMEIDQNSRRFVLVLLPGTGGTGTGATGVGTRGSEKQ
jgi:N-acetylmuramoyl-L-alanine amidase